MNQHKLKFNDEKSPHPSSIQCIHIYAKNYKRGGHHVLTMHVNLHH